MRILVSAIACDPSGGSEAGIGWRILEAIAHDHEVFALVGARNRAGWKAAMEDGRVPGSVRVRFVGDAKPWHANRLRARIQSWQEYRAFSSLQLELAEQWIASERIEIAHQVTYATWRVPSELWRLPIPFVWGPVGGAARFPLRFFGMLSGTGRLFEFVRGCATWVGTKSPGFRRCVRNAAMVVAANEETEIFLRPYREGAMERLWSGYLSADQVGRLRAGGIEGGATSGPLRIFAGGNIEGRKGVGLALEALARVKREGVVFKYVVAGGGPEVEKLKRQAAGLGLSEEEVQFHPGYRGDYYVHALRSAEVYLLPSFRETTPVTLLEAILAGCVPVVADASAAGEIVRNVGGYAIAPTSREELVAGLAEALLECSSKREHLAGLAEGMSERVRRSFGQAEFRRRLSELYARVGEQSNG